MKRTGKVVAAVLAILIVLIIGLAVSLPLLLDPNDYKDRVVQLVKDKTGRELTIGGKIGLSFFPWIGVELNKLSLSNAQGFGNAPFAQVEKSVVRVKLLPLLRKQVQVDKVVLTGLQLNLAKDASGKTNWADLTQSTGTDASPTAPAEPAAPSPLAALSVNGLDIRDSRLSWNDATSGSAYTLKNIALATGALAAGQETDVKLGVDIESKPATVSSKGGAKPAAGPPLRTRLELKTRAKLDPQAQTFNLADLQLTLGEMKLTGEVQGERLFTAPAFSGTVALAPFNLRTLLTQLGMNPETQDKDVLKKAALKSQFTFGNDALSLKGFSAQLDDSTLSGTFALNNFAKPAYRFDLKLDRFDLDRYLAPTPAAPTDSATTPPPTTAPAAPATPGAAPVAIPIETLRALDAIGTFRIGQFKAFAIRSSQVVLNLKAKDGLMQFGPTQAQLYGGSYAGNISYDARSDNPVLNLNEQLTGVQLGTFLQDTQNFDKFSGTGNVTLKLTGRGTNAQAITASLNGSSSFAVQNGVLKGIDVRKIGKQIAETAKTRRLEGLADVVPQAGDATPFQALRASAQIKNGIAFNEDLDLQGAGLKVSGKGSANLIESTVDYVANVNGFPLKISGPFAKLKYRPDWNAILKSQLDPRIEEEKQKLREKQDKLEEDTKQKLNKKLQEYLKR